MIRLNVLPCPVELTQEKIKKWTNAFLKDRKKSVWNKQFIKDTLAKMSANKCCYCEADLGIRGVYLEIEHFYPKNLYPLWVLSWHNLLPACKTCNGNKSNHDTLKEAIIHPAKDEPKEHLSFYLYRLWPKTEKGKTTIKLLGLNNRRRLVPERAKIADAIIEELEKLKEDIDNQVEITTIKRTNLRIKLTNILLEGTSTEPYSATVATVIVHDENFHFIKQFFQQQNWWNENFEHLEEQVLYCALEMKR